jgi:Fe-S-cluster containining protein
VNLLPDGDRALVQIVDAALADATYRSGNWLACRLGCTQCCVGVFSISQLDALRLQHGLAKLQAQDPDAATRIQQRSREAALRLSPDFPGDPSSGLLTESDAAEELFADFANDEPCPVLDPLTGACELYAYRPITCRAFGPPVRSDGGLGVCELCFISASDAQIAACEMEVDPDNLEQALLEELSHQTGRSGRTIIPFSLL